MDSSRFDNKSQTFYESFQANAIEFSKAQLSAFLGGIIDYGLMIICVELFGVTLLTAIVIGGLTGAIVNFTINRFWTFKNTSNNVIRQVLKFAIMAISSILLKAYGTNFFTTILDIDYKIIRLCVDAIVCFGFNYILQKFWIFKSKKSV